MAAGVEPCPMGNAWPWSCHSSERNDSWACKKKARKEKEKNQRRGRVLKGVLRTEKGGIPAAEEESQPSGVGRDQPVLYGRIEQDVKGPRRRHSYC